MSLKRFKRVFEYLILGTYILSTTKAQHTEPKYNHGFVVYYHADEEDIRFNSGSMRNSVPNSSQLLQKMLTNWRTNLRFHAFKAIPPRMIGHANRWAAMGSTTRDNAELSCQEAVEKIVAEICSAALVHTQIELQDAAIIT